MQPHEVLYLATISLAILGIAALAAGFRRFAVLLFVAAVICWGAYLGGAA